jgi:cellulose synthase/poly-beta-1,6-N-acetylglucosamine synthase-like glycosyltransferase
VYLAANVFQLLVVFYGSARMTRLGAGEMLPDEELPVYTVLVPLAGASRVSGTDPGADLITELSAQDYPTDRLQVLLLADGDEYATAALPDHFEIVAVGSPRRADACAAGLARARGELCVVYEPRQRPDRGQLRAAASSFSKLPAWVVGVRPETRCWNPRTNWLTQYAAAENAVRSVLLVRGLDRLQLPVPVGGFSCHYRTDALRRLGVWQDGDPAEGADIGVRIARRGWKVRVFASVTGEEAEGRLGQWLRQREASIRDDYRSWLAQTRSAYQLWRGLGPLRSTAFQLTTASVVVTALANPLLWLLALLWLAGGSRPIAGVLPPAELYTVLAVTLLGILLTAYSLMVGSMEHHIFVGVRMVLLAPVYVALTSVAAYRVLLPGIRPLATRRGVSSVATS